MLSDGAALNGFCVHSGSTDYGHWEGQRQQG